MDSKGLVSIITPTYNRRDFIVDAIESVIAQTYSDWELLIVDDGSTDDTKDLITPYLQDPRISYTYQSNHGQAYARQQALKSAKGQYVAFLDSDNLWLPERLEKEIVQLDANPDIDVCYGDLITIDEQGNELSRENMKRYSGDIAPLMIRQNFVSMNTTLIRKEAIERVGGFRSSVARGDDYDLYLRMSAESKFLYIKEYLAKYRVMENQISSNKEARFTSDFEIINHFIRNYPSAMSKLKWWRGLSSRYVSMGRYYVSQKNKPKAIKLLSLSVLYAPYWVGSWRALLKSIVA